VRIAINARFLLPSKMEGFGWYSYEITKRLVENNPQHEFYFFFDRPYDKRFIFGENVVPIQLNPPARHPILFIVWFELAVKSALKRYKIDVFFSPDGYLSLASSIPQIGVIHDINFEHYPKDLPLLARKYLQYFFPKFAKKATRIITVSNYSKADIVNSYKIEPSKVEVIWNGASSKFKLLEMEVKIQCQNRIAQGCPYFLFVGSIHPRKNVHRLIEAFALFKSKTKSDVKLVIVGESMWNKRDFKLTVDAEIKSEIIFTGHVSIDELALIMGSALALTYVPYFEGFGIPLVEAMKCGTPIISGDRTSLPEVAGEAALYCNPFDVVDIAEKMQMLQDSKELQQELQLKSIERSQAFSWDVSAHRVWEVITEVLQKNHL